MYSQLTDIIGELLFGNSFIYSPTAQCFLRQNPNQNPTNKSQHIYRPCSNKRTPYFSPNSRVPELLQVSLSSNYVYAIYSRRRCKWLSRLWKTHRYQGSISKRTFYAIPFLSSKNGITQILLFNYQTTNLPQ